jgi:hypothetical protein
VQPDAGLTVAGLGTFRGTIEVRRSGGGLAVVNDVALEDYVRGIEEVPAGWPAAALQAQAIAARTYALNRAASTDATPWRAVAADICATSTCQVYNGMAAERRPQGSSWAAAVDATAGRVLLSGGQPIFARYSATVEGPMAMSQDVAHAMAVAGAGASDILAAAYGGIRPTTLPPGRLPGTIRVALATSTAAVALSSTGPFRVVDGSGTQAAPTAAGPWRATAGPGGGVAVHPPPGAATATAPAAPDARRQVAVSIPRPGRAMIAATVPGGPDGPPVVLAALGALLAGGGTVALRRRRHHGRARAA